MSPPPGTASTWPAESVDGRARAEALAALLSGERTATAVVSYRSAGRALVLAQDPAAGRAACQRLRDAGLAPRLFVHDPEVPPSGDAGSGEMHGRLTELFGHLGSFIARAERPDGVLNVAAVLDPGQEQFDLVLDLSSTPAIRQAKPPPGYFAAGDAAALEEALLAMPELVGEFDKPRYFDLNPDICAHTASGLIGCRRCLDACPAGAIRSLADGISVDPHLCHGVGVCSTVCPSGAIRYAFPAVNELLDALRRMLRSYREAGGGSPCVLFHDDQAGRQALQEIAAQLPERVIPVPVEDVASLGMDTWLATIAYGANQVISWAPPGAQPASVQKALTTQHGYAMALLGGLGYPEDCLRISDEPAAALAAGLVKDTPGDLLRPATFTAFNEKRTVLGLALDHLSEQARRHRKSIDLPAGAPFGEIKVDKDACTLCMACVSVCPAAALADGEDLPKLIFTEANCVQCGLCSRACPETAITLSSRFVCDRNERNRARTLNEEEPFLCVVCGKPFATRSVMQRMREKLKGHWMYADPAQVRRLEMCEDCRVESLFQEGGGMEVYDKSGPRGKK
ncbi:MAG: 4Fe-4S dicluster domain-containing protein [Gammaproteobacteria bacterium]|nr:4Fe-4S dicluster domain-containing protein [Gammaproteobacteria bacterium]